MEAFFLPGAPGTGQRLCMHHAPAGEARAAVLYLHPWAEEMNKSRRMASLQSRALAQNGCAVLQIDLMGCGDSTGDLGDADWNVWLDDAARAVRWLRQRHDAPLWFWGLRAGALLATQAADHLAEPAHMLFWQAASSGKTLLQQFLRLRAAGDLGGGASKAAMEGLRRQLAEGSSVDVAGYKLSAALATGLESACLNPPRKCGRLAWLELSTRDGAAVLPTSAPVLTAWRDAGWLVQAQVVNGPAFWQTTEIEDAPSLIGATLGAIRGEPAE